MWRERKRERERMRERVCVRERERKPVNSRRFCLAARDSACFSLTRARTRGLFSPFFCHLLCFRTWTAAFLSLPPSVSLLGDAFSYTRENKYPTTTTSHTYIHAWSNRAV
ncbi:hypothetical protein LX32DRAFT_428561 [Colletotrichum zoysiae]|uniref:Uncharacterized protein n=1 Tax=Colletotrichum zoysiae TaxID=1216348 RepID=A0AAD9HFM0_9PEZI|nr:hypothetical protein LX32DRAFT_428561 [Colletotrichum zoysiae]